MSHDAGSDLSGAPAPVSDEPEADSGLSPAPAGPLSQRLMRGSLWTLVSTIAGVPVALVSTVVIARFLEPSGFGTYARIVFVVIIVARLSDIGTSDVIIRNAVRAFRDGLIDEQKQWIRYSQYWALTRFVLGTAIVAPFLRHDPAALITWTVAFLAVELSSGASFALLSRTDMSRLSVYSFAANTATAVGGMIGALATRSPEWAVALGWVGRAFATPVILALVPRDYLAACLTPKFRRLSAKERRFGFSSFVTGQLSNWIFGRSEVLFMTAGSARAGAGQYAAVSTLSQRVTLALDALYGPMAAGLAAVSDDGLSTALRRTMRVSVALISTACVAAIPAAAIVGPLLFGRGYGDLRVAIVALTAISLLQSMLQPLQSALFAIGRLSGLAAVCAAAAALDVVVLLSLLHTNAFLAAVVANACASLLYLVGLVVLTVRAMPVVRPDVLSGITELTLAAACGAGSLVCFYVLRPSVGSVVAALSSALVFLAVWLLLRRRRGALLSEAELAGLVGALPGRLQPAVRWGMGTLRFVNPSGQA